MLVDLLTDLYFAPLSARLRLRLRQLQRLLLHSRRLALLEVPVLRPQKQEQECS